MWYLIKAKGRTFRLEPREVQPFLLGWAEDDRTIEFINAQRGIPLDTGNLNALVHCHNQNLTLRYLGITRTAEDTDE